MPDNEVTYLDAVSQALMAEMEADESVFLIGEDVGVYGGEMLLRGKRLPAAIDPCGRTSFSTPRDIDEKQAIGKIDINEFATYVAVERSIAGEVVARLNEGRIKARSVKARLLKDGD